MPSWVQSVLIFLLIPSDGVTFASRVSHELTKFYFKQILNINFS